jgi:hypothetical protein
MPSAKSLLAIVVTLILAVTTALLATGYSQRSKKIRDLDYRLALAHISVTSAQSDARDSRLDATRAAERARSAGKRYRAERDRLLNPTHGRIPRRALGSLTGSMDRFAPRGTRITALEPISPTASVPEQVVVAWTARTRRYGLPDSGVLLWEAVNGFAATQGLYETPFSWRVIFDWHESGIPYRAHLGPPGDIRTRPEELTNTVSAFSVGDITGDGHPDVLAWTDPQGSGACSVWRVLSSSPSGTARVIFSRSTCDTGISMQDGQLLVDTPVYRRGCSIHGCGDRIHTLLRWAGSSWLVTSRTHIGTP